MSDNKKHLAAVPNNQEAGSSNPETKSSPVLCSDSSSLIWKELYELPNDSGLLWLNEGHYQYHAKTDSLQNDKRASRSDDPND